MGAERLVIHIGTHKAGSTALQIFLASNRAAFAEHGIFLPGGGMHPVSGHHSNIVWHSLRPDLFDPGHGTLDDLVSDLRRADAGTALISSEEFELLPDRGAVETFLAPLRAVAGRIDLLLYVRPQFQYAASAYSEALKHGNVGYFDDFFAQAICWNRLDYGGYFDKWLGHADTHLTVRPMTRDLRQRGIGADLLDLLAIGDATDRFDPGPRRNVALGPEVVYALLYAKFRAAYRGPALDRDICAAIRRQVTGLVPTPRRFSALTPAQVARCERLHRAGNAAFTARHGLPDWQTLFGQDIATAGEAQATDVPRALQGQIEAIVDRLMASTAPPLERTG